MGDWYGRVIKLLLNASEARLRYAATHPQAHSWKKAGCKEFERGHCMAELRQSADVAIRDEDEQSIVSTQTLSCPPLRVTEMFTTGARCWAENQEHEKDGRA